MHDTRTRSPTLMFFTPEPTSVTVPTASWPRIRPSVTAGTSPLRMWRSVPQIVTASTRTIASVSACKVGFGTSSHDLFPGPRYTRAFMSELLGGRSVGEAQRYGRTLPSGRAEGPAVVCERHLRRHV